MGILEGAIIGAIVGGATVVFQSMAKDRRFKSIRNSLQITPDYAGLYHYASFKRYKQSFKYYDSYGALYLQGNKVYYKSSPGETPMEFDMNECSIQLEADWRWLKWFSITRPSGEKFYFNSSKMGALKNNSDETLKGYAAIKAVTKTA